jgi:hypothetical protein
VKGLEPGPARLAHCSDHHGVSGHGRSAATWPRGAGSRSPPCDGATPPQPTSRPCSGRPMGFIAIEAGWVVTEVGRQPWIISGVLRTAGGHPGRADSAPSPCLPCSTCSSVPSRVDALFQIIRVRSAGDWSRRYTPALAAQADVHSIEAMSSRRHLIASTATQAPWRRLVGVWTRSPQGLGGIGNVSSSPPRSAWWRQPCAADFAVPLRPHLLSHRLQPSG